MGKRFAIAFAATALLYTGAYKLIERLRIRKGPWRITFSLRESTPVISVAQPSLNITNVEFRFPGARIEAAGLPQTVVFDRPLTNVPFGSISFIDTTFQPGTIMLRVFGNEIQLLPRALTVNRREIQWNSLPVIELPPTNRVELPRARSRADASKP